MSTTKSTQWPVHTAKTQISLGIHSVWSVFAVRMKKPWVLSFSLSSVSLSCKPVLYILNQVLFTVFSTWPVRPAKTQISQSDQSSLSSWRNLGSLASHWAHSEDSVETGGCPQADQSLCWAHRSFCWFCHAVAQFLFPKFAMNSLEKKKTCQRADYNWALSRENLQGFRPGKTQTGLLSHRD